MRDPVAWRDGIIYSFRSQETDPMSLIDDTKATRRLPKWLLGLAALAVVAALAWFFFGNTGKPPREDEAVPQPNPAAKTPAPAPTPVPAAVPIERKAGA
jgi:hypothetical protein